MVAAAESCARCERAGKPSLDGLLRGQFRLHHQGFNAESLERFRRTPSHTAAQDRLAVLKDFAHGGMVVAVGGIVFACAMAIALSVASRFRSPIKEIDPWWKMRPAAMSSSSISPGP